MDSPLTDLEATVGIYQFRSYGGEQQDRQGGRAVRRRCELDIAANWCVLTDLEVTVGTYHFRSYGDEQSGKNCYVASPRCRGEAASYIYLLNLR